MSVYRECSWLQLDLPAVLLKLAEQISPATKESLTMSVLCKNGNSLDVKLKKNLYQEEERIILDVSAPDGSCVFECMDEDRHSLDLGSVQSPVYLQNLMESDIQSTNSRDQADEAETLDSHLPMTDSAEVSRTTDLTNLSVHPLSSTNQIDNAVNNVDQENVIHVHQLATEDCAENMTETITEDPSMAETPKRESVKLSEVDMETTVSTDGIQQMAVEFDADVVKREILQMEGLTEEKAEHEEVRTLSDILDSEGVAVKHAEEPKDSEAYMEAQVLDDSASLNGQAITILEKDGSLTASHIQIEVKDENEDGVLIDSSSVILLDTGNSEKPMEVVAGDDLGNFIVLNQQSEGGNSQEVLTVAESEWWTTQVPDRTENVQEVTDIVAQLHCEMSIQDMDTPPAGSPAGKKLGIKRAARLPAVAMSTGEIALESSIKVQDVKDIPKVMMDINGFRCRICSKIFNSRKLITGHFTRCHQEAEITEQDTIPIVIKDAFLCYICHQPFRRFDAVRKHLESVHKMEMHKRKIVRLVSCPICGSKHSSYHTLRCHLSYKHRNDPQYNEALVSLQTQSYHHKKPLRQDCILLQCPWCQLNLTMKQFRHHVKTAHQTENDIQTVINDALEAIRVQKLEKYRKAIKHCKICKKDFPMKQYYSHMRRMHQYSTKPLNIKCDLCNKLFGSNWHLKMHSLVHSDERNFTCEECGNAFRSKYALRYHVNTVHLNRYRYVCEVCKRGFHSKRSMNQHHCDPAWTPRKKRNYNRNGKSAKKSINAPKETSSQTSAGKDNDNDEAPSETSVVTNSSPTTKSNGPMRQETFLEIMDSGLFKCKVCGKEFKSRMSVSTHLRRVHHISRTPIQEYKCSQCGKVFILESRLRTHLATHLESSHQCTQCVKSFKDKYTLRNHVRVVHERNYTFPCHKCGRGFEKRNKLHKHDCQQVTPGSQDSILTDKPKSVHRETEAITGSAVLLDGSKADPTRPELTDDECGSSKKALVCAAPSLEPTPKNTAKKSVSVSDSQVNAEVVNHTSVKLTNTKSASCKKIFTPNSKLLKKEQQTPRRHPSCESKTAASRKEGTPLVAMVTENCQTRSMATGFAEKTPRVRNQPKWLTGYGK